MYWLDYLLPSCCTKKLTIAIPPKPKDPQISILDSINSPSAAYSPTLSDLSPVENSEFQLLKLQPCFESSENISRVTTNSSLTPIETLGLQPGFICSYCHHPATGHCSSCLGKKYCMTCFLSFHGEKQIGRRPHKLISPI
ncbi:hypothetical protein SteCoe_14554 [Stentor coeruleus]|uniref:Uncharacterized protein n=1 Tax=Stentor coeruleus TaxID=5963 RepID=A0A1R2C5S0_9CILI|nr:hypothetical protein SteCoe_14554 [Stentor coeruleus]